VLVVVLDLGALGFRDRKETDALQLMGRVAGGWWLERRATGSVR
jgi:hypothetical protein